MLEELLYQHMVEHPALTSLLCSYQNAPAIFYQKSPRDEDLGWDGLCFPRLGYNLDFSFDPERKQGGTLSIDVWVCSLNLDSQGRNPEIIIGNQLISLISGTFYTPSDAIPIWVVWRDTAAFWGHASALNREASPVETFGLTLTFDLIALPKQESFAPDPVSALMHWSKQTFPESTILGLDPLPPIWRPSDDNPTLYWRSRKAEPIRELFACTWYLGELECHIACDTIPQRNEYGRAIAQALHSGTDFPLDDGSFMRVDRSIHRKDANPISEGQVTLWGEYGVLSKRYAETHTTPLTHGFFRLDDTPSPSLPALKNPTDPITVSFQNTTRHNNT